MAAPLREQQQPHAAASPGPVGQGGEGGEGRRDEDGAGPWVNTVSWPRCRVGDRCLYGEWGKWGRCEPRGGVGDVFVSEHVSKVGSEATVGSMLDVRDDIRCLLLCICNSGELCDECPLKG